jgi:hypothetical protein
MWKNNSRNCGDLLAIKKLDLARETIEDRKRTRSNVKVL